MTFRNKTLAAALAAFGGTLGLHRFYLAGPRSPWPWLCILFCWTLIPTFAGFIDALRFAVMPDDRWDAHWNAGTGRTSRSGWPVVVLAVLTLFGGMVLFMGLLSFALSHWSGSGETLSLF